jgi:hypothetical protein
VRDGPKPVDLTDERCPFCWRGFRKCPAKSRDRAGRVVGWLLLQGPTLPVAAADRKPSHTRTSDMNSLDPDRSRGPTVIAELLPATDRDRGVGWGGAT